MSYEEHYIIQIDAPASMGFILNSNTFNHLVRRYCNKKGWSVLYSGYFNGHYEMYVAATGSILIILLVAAIIALIGGAIAGYLVKQYRLIRVSDNVTIAEAEMTEQAIIEALKDIYQDETIDEDIRESAANKLIELGVEIVDSGPNGNGNGNGWFPDLFGDNKQAITVLIGIALAAYAFKK